MVEKRRAMRRRYQSRPIPRRGQVKAGIAVGLARSVGSFFSMARCGTGSYSRLMSQPGSPSL
ncbi:hypothetical protein IHE45_19G163000 [Dioscorea alata]|uniref:Uncharacterized protein n=1 Tax=Dioscorea alata TaxID=55571 RepID=A0ACB7U393_DIOAL|nr:hypothetical protein IHE45_19G163000 [Dioscorea alata]